MSKKKGFKKSYAIIILLLITVGASVIAFFWLSSVEKHIEYGNKLIIDEIVYDAGSHDMKVHLINGLATAVPVKSSGSAREVTVVTMYPYGEPTAMPECTWVGIGELACSGSCDTDLEPKSEAEMVFQGEREKCLLDLEELGDQYHLELFFGKERVEQNFKI